MFDTEAQHNDGYDSSPSRASSKRSFSIYRQDLDHDGHKSSTELRMSKDKRGTFESGIHWSESRLSDIVGDSDDDKAEIDLQQLQTATGGESITTDPDPSWNYTVVSLERSDLDSHAKRRKHLPKSTHGYPCREPGCDKMFDYNGERTKHERIHKPPAQRPHGCQYCDKRFIDQKDAKRHELVHLRKWMPKGLKGRTETYVH